MITIRRATRDDFEILADFILAYLYESESMPSINIEASPENALAYYDSIVSQGIDNDDAVLLAFDGDTPVGSIWWCEYRGQIKTKFRSATGETYVIPSRRREGIASLLRAEAATILKDKGVTHIMACIDSSNTASMGAIPNNTAYVGGLYRCEL